MFLNGLKVYIFTNKNMTNDIQSYVFANATYTSLQSPVRTTQTIDSTAGEAAASTQVGTLIDNGW